MSWWARQNFVFFCHLCNAWFYGFSIGQSSSRILYCGHLTQYSHLVQRCKFLDVWCRIFVDRHRASFHLEAKSMPSTSMALSCCSQWLHSRKRLVRGSAYSGCFLSATQNRCLEHATFWRNTFSAARVKQQELFGAWLRKCSKIDCTYLLSLCLWFR